MIYHFAKCCSTERHFAHHSAESHSVESHSVEYCSAEYCSAEYCSAEYCSAEYCSAESHSAEYYSAEYYSAKSTLFSNVQIKSILLLIDNVQLCVILTNAILLNAMAPNQALIFTYGVLIIICPKEFFRR
jgi:hypothetical protein